MKKLILFILIPLLAGAQKYDNTWILGYHYYPSYVPALDFFYGYPDTVAYNSPIEFFGADVSMCNAAGDLQFYTDGSTVCNFTNDTLQGSINFNFDTSIVNYFGSVSLPKQSIIALPYPDHPGQYVLLHIFGHIWNNNQEVQPIRFAKSVVDMNMNSGLGEMVQKDITVFSDTLLYGTLEAVKHANGRDWWVLIHRWKSNTFYKVLLTPYSCDLYGTQQEGPYFEKGMNYYNGQAIFSPDGSHYAIARSDSQQVCVFDFDRCTGNLLYLETIDLTSVSTTGIVYGCSFSPSGRFLYVTDGKHLYQYDMTSTTISSSMIKIADWDGSGSLNPYYFLFHRNGPDGKIYISAPPSVYFHVINDPDQLDTLCDFVQRDLKLKTYHAGYLPEFPNYRLSRISGSACDTLQFTAIESAGHFKFSLSPNPSSGDIFLEYNLPENSDATFEVYSSIGNRVFSKIFPKYSIKQHIDLSHLDKGIYFCKLKTNKGSLSQKVVLQ